MKVVITGPTGAIGCALLEICRQQHIEALAVCRKGSPRNRELPKAPFIRTLELDLCEYGQAAERLSDNYDVFFHLAWEGAGRKHRCDAEIQEQNIRFSLDAVKLAAALGCHTFVGAGSQAEYGRFEGKLSEDTPVHPENAYGMAKLAAGGMTRILCEQLGIRHIWTRILSVYGPHDGEDTMIMTAIRDMLSRSPTRFTKGEQQWDYLYSEDAARALLLLGQRGKHGKVYPLGSGNTRTLKEYIEIIKNRIDPNIRPGYGDIPYGRGQVMYLCADISALIRDTAMKPETSFEDGIEKTIEWVRKREEITGA